VGGPRGELAAVLGVCQSAVSQWERVREPSGLHQAVLLRALAGLADLLDAQATAARGRPAGTRAS
jgi:hypothetical protein